MGNAVLDMKKNQTHWSSKDFQVERLKCAYMVNQQTLVELYVGSNCVGYMGKYPHDTSEKFIFSSSIGSVGTESGALQSAGYVEWICANMEAKPNMKFNEGFV